MAQLPEDRTEDSTVQEHVDDHLELARLHNLLEDQDLPARVDALETSGVTGMRAVRVPLTPDIAGLDDGIVIATLADGEQVFRILVRVSEVWDGTNQLKVGTPDDTNVYTGGWTLDVLDSAAAGPWATSGLLSPQLVEYTWVPGTAVAYAPPEGMDIVLTIDDGEGGPHTGTVGAADLLLIILAGY